MMQSKKIKITCGETRSDCTAPYKVTIPEGMTVREFIAEWLEDPREWGYFGIYDGRLGFGNPKCEYRDGKIITDPLPDDILDSEIKKVIGDGGWSRSDFVFIV